MDLLVKNVLTSICLKSSACVRTGRDRPNTVVSETTDHCVSRLGSKASNSGWSWASAKANLDPLHLERIVANLLTSAIRRTPAGEVRLRTSQRGGWSYSRSATPVRSDPNEIEHIFDRPTWRLTGHARQHSDVILRTLSSKPTRQNPGQSRGRLGLNLVVHYRSTSPLADWSCAPTAPARNAGVESHPIL